jgi:hypothetical protein
MVLPLLDSMAISPWSLTSATVPPGLPLPQFHETEMALSVMISFESFFFSSSSSSSHPDPLGGCLGIIDDGRRRAQRGGRICLY